MGVIWKKWERKKGDFCVKWKHRVTWSVNGETFFTHRCTCMHFQRVRTVSKNAANVEIAISTYSTCHRCHILGPGGWHPAFVGGFQTGPIGWLLLGRNFGSCNSATRRLLFWGSSSHTMVAILAKSRSHATQLWLPLNYSCAMLTYVLSVHSQDLQLPNADGVADSLHTVIGQMDQEILVHQAFFP